MKWILIALLATSAIAVAEWSTPVNLGPVVNSSAVDDNPTISSNGSYIIFKSSRSGGFGNRDIWISLDSSGTWLAPTNLGANVNTSKGEATPFLAEGDTKLFYTIMNDPGGYGNYDIWWCAISGGTPGVRSNLGAPPNTSGGEHSPVLSPDGNTMYFASNRSAGGYGNYDIWVSTKSGGVWQTPTNLGGTINTDTEDRPHWISDDGNTLVLSSFKTDGSFGGRDLWYSIKSGSVWGTPVNFGSKINSADNEAGCTFIDNAGQIGGTMYFASNRSGGYGETDLWESTFTTNIKSASLGQIKATFK